MPAIHAHKDTILIPGGSVTRNVHKIFRLAHGAPYPGDIPVT